MDNFSHEHYLKVLEEAIKWQENYGTRLLTEGGNYEWKRRQWKPEDSGLFTKEQEYIAEEYEKAIEVNYEYGDRHITHTFKNKYKPRFKDRLRTILRKTLWGITNINNRTFKSKKIHDFMVKVIIKTRKW